MAIQLTYFVHGTTTDNEQEIASGWHDVGLSDLGKQQSKDLKDLIDMTQFDVVFCSDLKRAVESAEITFKGAVPIIQDKRLRECNYGDYTARSTSVVDPLQRQMISTPFPGGESYEDVKARIADFVQFLRDNYDGKRVAIVAHKAPQFAFDVLLKGKSWDEALASDWRLTKAWQPGWKYTIA